LTTANGVLYILGSVVIFGERWRHRQLIGDDRTTTNSQLVRYQQPAGLQMIEEALASQH